MPVFRDVTMEWGGEVYTITPSNRLLRQIEGQGISLPHMLMRISEGKPPVSEVAFVAQEFLRSAGAKVGEDEIYGECLADLQTGGEGFADLVRAIAEAVSPTEVAPKNVAAPAKKKAGGK